MEEKKDIDPQRQVKERNKYTAHSFVFHGSRKTFVLYNKTEKIVGALYLLTSLFPANDPLVSSLRSGGLEALSFILALASASSGEDKQELSRVLQAKVLELVSSCDIAEAAGYLSSMNAGIVREELLKVSEFARQESREVQSGFTLSPELFAVDSSPVFRELSSDEPLASSLWKSSEGYKGHDKGHLIKDKVNVRYNAPKALPKAQRQTLTPSERKKKIVSRTETILGLFKQKESLTIKDIVTIIKDCSEKTIQRDLLSLVQKGVLKKEGERRWSTYTLA